MAIVSVNVPEKAWTLVAENTKEGLISLPLNMGHFQYYFTTRDHGAAAPSDTQDTEPLQLDSGNAKRMFHNQVEEEIRNDAFMDVYVWAFDSDSNESDTARVLVDI